MSDRRRYTRLAGIAVLAAAGAAGSYRGAQSHARHYSGTEPRTVNCYTCHVTGAGGGLADRFAPPAYRTPLNLVVAPDDRTVYVTAQDAHALVEVDVARGRVARTIDVGRRPHGVALSADGSTAYVSNEWDNTVSVVQLGEGRVLRTFEAGDQPAGIAVGPDGRTLYVASRGNDQVLAMDAAAGQVTARLAAGSSPGQVSQPRHARLVVTNELSSVGPVGEVPVSEVTVIDAASGRVVLRPALVNAHLSEGVAVTPDGRVALVALMQPKNLVPIIQVARGWVTTNGLAVVDLESGRAVQVLLDEPDRFFADPFGVALTPDGAYALVTHSGADVVSVIDVARLQAFVDSVAPEDEEYVARDLSASRRFVVARIPTGSNPKGVAVSHDGRTAFVAERLGDTLLTIDTRTWTPIGRIPLGDTSRETTLRRGERLFNSAAATFQGQFSCRSCHPNDHVDRLQYDFEPDGLGRDILDNRSLLGLADTAPFKWNGKNTSMFMQCGIRFARILTRLEALPPADLAALVAFMRSLKPVANPHLAKDGTLTPSQQRGKEIYERTTMRDGTPIRPEDQCVTCHPAPLYTTRRPADVGTGSTDSSVREFDTPHLTNVYGSAPYLHDGRARTLEEIWTIHNPDDRHGITRDISKRELNELIEYLKTL